MLYIPCKHITEIRLTDGHISHNHFRVKNEAAYHTQCQLHNLTYDNTGSRESVIIYELCVTPYVTYKTLQTHYLRPLHINKTIWLTITNTLNSILEIKSLDTNKLVQALKPYLKKVPNQLTSSQQVQETTDKISETLDSIQALPIQECKQLKRILSCYLSSKIKSECIVNAIHKDDIASEKIADISTLHYSSSPQITRLFDLVEHCEECIKPKNHKTTTHTRLTCDNQAENNTNKTQTTQQANNQHLSSKATPAERMLPSEYMAQSTSKPPSLHYLLSQTQSDFPDPAAVKTHTHSETIDSPTIDTLPFTLDFFSTSYNTEEVDNIMQSDSFYTQIQAVEEVDSIMQSDSFDTPTIQTVEEALNASHTIEKSHQNIATNTLTIEQLSSTPLAFETYIEECKACPIIEASCHLNFKGLLSCLNKLTPCNSSAIHIPYLLTEITPHSFNLKKSPHLKVKLHLAHIKLEAWKSIPLLQLNDRKKINNKIALQILLALNGTLPQKVELSDRFDKSSQALKTYINSEAVKANIENIESNYLIMLGIQALKGFLNLFLLEKEHSLENLIAIFQKKRFPLTESKVQHVKQGLESAISPITNRLLSYCIQEKKEQKEVLLHQIINYSTPQKIQTITKLDNNPYISLCNGSMETQAPLTINLEKLKTYFLILPPCTSTYTHTPYIKIVYNPTSNQWKLDKCQRRTSTFTIGLAHINAKHWNALLPPLLLANKAFYSYGTILQIIQSLNSSENTKALTDTSSTQNEKAITVEELTRYLNEKDLDIQKLLDKWQIIVGIFLLTNILERLTKQQKDTTTILDLIKVYENKNIPTDNTENKRVALALINSSFIIKVIGHLLHKKATTTTITEQQIHFLSSHEEEKQHLVRSLHVCKYAQLHHPCTLLPGKPINALEDISDLEAKSPLCPEGSEDSNIVHMLSTELPLNTDNKLITPEKWSMRLVHVHKHDKDKITYIHDKLTVLHLYRSDNAFKKEVFKIHELLHPQGKSEINIKEQLEHIANIRIANNLKQQLITAHQNRLMKAPNQYLRYANEITYFNSTKMPYIFQLLQEIETKETTSTLSSSKSKDKPTSIRKRKAINQKTEDSHKKTKPNPPLAANQH